MKKNPKRSLESILKLVQNARSTDETRYFMSEAYYDSGKLVATDGLRLVVFEPSSDAKKIVFGWNEAGDIPSGYVDIDPKNMIARPSVKQTIKDAQFPTYTKVIPAREALRQSTSKILDVEPGDHLTRLVRFMVREHVAFNPEHLLDIPIDNNTKVYFNADNPDRRPAMVVLDDYGYGAVSVIIMPSFTD